MNRPDKMILALTNRCTTNCGFCYRREVRGDDLSFDTLRRLLDEFGPDLRQLRFAGAGEPLHHREFARFAQYARATLPDVELQLTSNAQRLGEYLAEVATCFDVVWFSLNASTPETYARMMPGQYSDFEYVCNSIRALEGPSRRLSFLITKDNIHEAIWFPEFAFELGADRVTFQALDRALNFFKYYKLASPWEDLAKVREYIDNMDDDRVQMPPVWAFDPDRFPPPQGETIACGCATRTFGVFWTSGEVTPCCYMASLVDRYSLGNIYEDDLCELWERQRMMDAKLRSGFVPAVCRDCLNYWSKDAINLD